MVCGPGARWQCSWSCKDWEFPGMRTYHVSIYQEDQQRASRGTPVCKGGEREGTSQQRGNRKGRMRHKCCHRIFQEEVQDATSGAGETGRSEADPQKPPCVCSSAAPHGAHTLPRPSSAFSVANRSEHNVSCPQLTSALVSCTSSAPHQREVSSSRWPASLCLQVQRGIQTRRQNPPAKAGGE